MFLIVKAILTYLGSNKYKGDVLWTRYHSKLAWATPLRMLLGSFALHGLHFLVERALLREEEEEEEEEEKD